MWETTLFPLKTRSFCPQFPQSQDGDCRSAGVFMDWRLAPFAVLITLYIWEIKMSFLMISVRKALQHFQVQRGGDANDQRQAVMNYPSKLKGAEGPSSCWLVMLSWLPAPARSPVPIMVAESLGLHPLNTHRWRERWSLPRGHWGLNTHGVGEGCLPHLQMG